MENGSFSNTEKFDMLSCYIVCQRNCVDAERAYSNKYPERRQPGKSIFRRLVFNLKEYGSFKKPVVSRQKQSNEESQRDVLQAVVENPEISTRTIEDNTGVAKSTAHFILKKNKYHPYKFRICHGLRPGDDARRRTFCEWYTRKCQDDENFPFKIIWSDESMITNNGIFNRRNVHYWSQQNPRVHKVSRHQHRFGFNMWVGILGTNVIGPFIYRNNLTKERYINLLVNDLEDALDNLPLAVTHSCWFQQDGAPAHNAIIVRDYLNRRFPGQWIGTHSDTPWPARAPDLTPLDFFLWGHIKNQVYSNHNFQNEEDLLRLVTASFNNICPNMLTQVLNSSVRRAYLCLENNGGLFEHLL